MFDRIENQQLSLTQETIATMPGVRRERVIEAAGRLQAEGLISYVRGHKTLCTAWVCQPKPSSVMPWSHANIDNWRADPAWLDR
jgi:hypothetical protein